GTAARGAGMSAPAGEPVHLDGRSLTRAQLVAVARGASVTLDEGALRNVARAAAFLADKAEQGAPIYGVTTGFGMNADKLLAGAGHALRGASEKLPRKLGRASCRAWVYVPEV